MASRKSTPYRLGYQTEHFCRLKLRDIGAMIIRSAGSRSPADLVAVFPDKHEIWLIQVKRDDAPSDTSKLSEKFSDLSKLKGVYNVKTFVFMRIHGKYTFIEV